MFIRVITFAKTCNHEPVCKRMPLEITFHSAPFFFREQPSFENPKPSIEWNDNTKCAAWRRPRPSSPWIRSGNVDCKSSLPAAASWNTWCPGSAVSKLRQNAWRIARSRCRWGRFNPCSMCIQELLMKNSNQSCILRTGMFGISGKWVRFTCKAIRNFPTRTLWQSLSGLFVLQAARFKSPPLRSATSGPTSATKSRADFTTEEQVA